MVHEIIVLLFNANVIENYWKPIFDGTEHFNVAILNSYKLL